MEDEKQKVKFAVVGCGHIGKRHIEMIAQNSSAELLAYADIIKPLLDECIINKATYFDSLNDLLASKISSLLDVICIATPNGLHASMAMQVLDAGKHVVLEKPMTLSKADAEQIIFKSIDAHRHVFVVKQNRYSPPISWLKNLVADNVLGNIYMVLLNCFWNRDERYYIPGSWHGSKEMDGGTLFTQFSHFLDIMFWIFGDIKNIKSNIRNFRKLDKVEFEDCGIAQFEFVKSGMGCINFSTAVWNKNMESSITVIAENGSLKIGGQYMNTLEYCHIKNYATPQLSESNAGNDYGMYQGSASNHQYIFENVINVIRNKSSISANALEGMKVIDIIERIYSCAKD